MNTYNVGDGRLSSLSGKGMWRRLVGIAGSYFRRSYRQMKKVIGGDEPQQSQEKSLVPQERRWVLAYECLSSLELKV